jgi:MutS domain V
MPHQSLSTDPTARNSALAEDIRPIYERRLDERNWQLERCTRRDRRIADARLAVFVVLVVLGFLIIRGAAIPLWWLALPGAMFVALIMVHEPVRRAADRARRSVQFYSNGLARLDGRWAGTGSSGLPYLHVEHPYAADLDLFGTGSLFEKLCTARTRSGEDTLAAWLLAPASPEAIAERHQAVRELRPQLDLREDLELLGVDVGQAIDPAALAEWGTARRVFPGFWVPLVAIILGVLGTTALVGWLFFEFDLTPLLFVLICDGLFARLVSDRVRTVLSAVERRTADLVLLSEMLQRLETHPFEAPLLRRLVKSLETEGHPASAQIRRLARLLHLLDYRRNQLFAPFGALWLWTTHIAVRIDGWRSGPGPRIAHWLAAIGEFEALCALACYAAENPLDAFPQMSVGPAQVDAEAIGHPLIERRDCVFNDVSLGGRTHALIVSGSNMSGKSTLLRTVGINTVLALAGAPVRATKLRLTPMAVGATLRIQDSLQAGRSRFYAEITRVRQLVELSRGDLPLLFLFDELFNGTNSHDRFVGAEAVVKGLIDRGAIGMVTTHDLALTEFGGAEDSRITNVHFADRLVDGKMVFDYRMRPGVVQHSNALALMRAIGLEV